MSQKRSSRTGSLTNATAIKAKATAAMTANARAKATAAMTANAMAKANVTAAMTANAANKDSKGRGYKVPALFFNQNYLSRARLINTLFQSAIVTIDILRESPGFRYVA